MRKSKFKQTMSMLLAVLMVFMSMNFSVFAEELTAPTDETTTTTVEAPAEQPAEKQTPAVEALAPVDEETGTTEENAVIQETPAMMALNDSEYLTPGTPALDEMTGKECFFANGTPITIEETTTEGKGAKITWDGGSQEVSSAANIFGGGHNHDGTYESTSVTMTGGTVNAVFGGGLHKSHVATANVVIKDGAVIGQIAGGAASSFSGTTCHQPWPGSDSPNAFVDTANATIEGGTIKGSALVYGGGEGMSQTGNTNLNITGGTFDKAYIIPGGSNGTTTGTAKVEISTDIKDSIVQGINRGKTENIVIDIKTGAKVNKVYAGGETGDSSVTGTIEKTTVNIAADSAVANLQPGTNGGIEIAPNSTELITLNYDDSAVINEGENTLEKLETRFGAAVLGKTTKAIAVADVEGKVISGYDDIQTAVDKAPSDSIIKLQKNIDVNQTIQYGNKNLTFDGNNKTYKLTSTAKDRIFMLTGTGDTGTGLTLINLEVIGNNTNQRGIHVGDITDTTDNNHYKSQITLDNAELKFDFCVDPRGINFGDGQHQGSVITLTNNSKILNGLNQEYENNWGNSGNGSRGLSLWNPEDVTVNIEKNSALKGFKYAVNVSGTQQVVGDKLLADAGGLNVTVDNSTIYGWAAFNIWASYGTYNIQNGSVLKGINTVEGAAGSANAFTAIKLNYDWPADNGDGSPVYQTYDNVLNITNSTITNGKTGSFDQYLLSIDNAETVKSINLTGAHFVDVTGTIESAINIYDDGNKSGSVSKAIDAVKAKTTIDTASTSLYQPAEGEAKSLPFYDIVAVNGEKEYQNIQDAIDDAVDNDTITVKEGIHNIYQAVKVDKPVTIKGDKNVIITPGDTWTPDDNLNDSGEASLFNVTSDNVTLENLTVQGARKVSDKTGHGINIYCGDNVSLKNITAKDNAGCGIVVNSSSVTAEGLMASGNGWQCSVNVDQGANTDKAASFTLTGNNTLKDTYQVKSDGYYNPDSDITVDLPSSFVESSVGENGAAWTDESSMIKNLNNKRTYVTISDAVQDARNKQTISIPAGTYSEDITIDNKSVTLQGQGDSTVVNGTLTVQGKNKPTLNAIKAAEALAVQVKLDASVDLTSCTDFTGSKITAEKYFAYDYDTSRVMADNKVVDGVQIANVGKPVSKSLVGDTYTVTEPAELYWLAEQINSGTLDSSGITIKLADSLDADGMDFKGEAWLPIGTADHPFKGTFDGNGKTIKNLTVKDQENAGLFGCVETQDSIKDITIESVSITVGANSGALVGISKKGTYIKCQIVGIENTVTATDCAGGLIGFVSSESESDNQLGGCSAVIKTLTANKTGSLVGDGKYQNMVVNQDTGEFFDTIQNAIDAENTKDGNTILIPAGLYDLTNKHITLSKDVTLVGSTEGDQRTVFKCDEDPGGANGESNTMIAMGSGKDAKLQNIEINITKQKQSAINFSCEGKLSVENCRFTGAEGISGHNLIYGGGQSKATVIFKNNVVDVPYRVSITSLGNDSEVTGNSFNIGTESIEGDGRTSVLSVVADSGNIKIENNTFNGANRGIGVDWSKGIEPSNISVKSNKFINTRYALELDSTKNKGNYDVSKNYYQWGYEAVGTLPHVQDASIEVEDPTKDFDAEYQGNLVKKVPYYLDAEMTQLSAPVIISREGKDVDGYDTIGEAIQNAQDGDILKLEGKTFIEDITINKALTLQGAAKAEDGTAKTSKIEGKISITAKDVAVKNVDAEATTGALTGVVVTQNGAAVTLENTTITNKSIENGACGIRMEGVSDNLTIKNSTITAAKYYGIGVRNMKQTLKVEGSTISGWAAIMTSAGGLKDEDKGKTATETVITVKDSNLMGYHASGSNASEAYGTVVLQEDYEGVTFKAENTLFYAGVNTIHGENPAHYQYGLTVRPYDCTIDLNNCKFEKDNNNKTDLLIYSTVNSEGGAEQYEESGEVTNNTFNLKDITWVTGESANDPAQTKLIGVRQKFDGTKVDQITWSNTPDQANALTEANVQYNLLNPEGNAINVSNAGQLLWIADQVNSGKDTFAGKTITLTDDIDLSSIENWTPIGIDDSQKAFAGTFDGGSHTISGLKVDTAASFAGLFGAVNGGAAIKNLTIDKAQIKTSDKNAGVLIGGTTYANQNSLTIENVNITNSQVEALGRVGGVIGWIKDSIKPVSISGCSVNGSTISGINDATGDEGDKVGGIVGVALGKTTITGCNVGDTAETTITGCRDVGGIIGLGQSASTIEQCNIGKSAKINLKFINPIDTFAKRDINVGVGGIVGTYLGQNALTLTDNVVDNATEITTDLTKYTAKSNIEVYKGRYFGAPRDIKESIATLTCDTANNTEITFYGKEDAAESGAVLKDIIENRVQAGDTVNLAEADYTSAEAITIGKALTINGLEADKALGGDTAIGATGQKTGINVDAQLMITNSDESVMPVKLNGISVVTGTAKNHGVIEIPESSKPVDLTTDNCYLEQITAGNANTDEGSTSVVLDSADNGSLNISASYVSMPKTYQRGIDNRGSETVVDIRNSKVYGAAPTQAAPIAYTRAISICGDKANTSINQCEIDVTDYGIYADAATPVINVTDSNITGWAALDVHKTATVTTENCNLTGRSYQTGNNGFATIVLEQTKDTVVNCKGGSITSETINSGITMQYLVMLKYSNQQNNTKNSSVNIVDSELKINGAPKLAAYDYRNENAWVNITGNSTITFNGNPGYAVMDNNNVIHTAGKDIDDAVIEAKNDRGEIVSIPASITQIDNALNMTQAGNVNFQINGDLSINGIFTGNSGQSKLILTNGADVTFANTVKNFTTIDVKDMPEDNPSVITAGIDKTDDNSFVKGNVSLKVALSEDGTQRTWTTEHRTDGFDKGNGTKAYPFTIATPEQLTVLAQKIEANEKYTALTEKKSYADAYYQLTSDITVNTWTPIGKTNAFNGHFDGNGTTSALFGTTGSSAVIEKLNVTGSFLQMVTNNEGTIKNSSAMFVNCSSSAMTSSNAGKIENSFTNSTKGLTANGTDGTVTNSFYTADITDLMTHTYTNEDMQKARFAIKLNGKQPIEDDVNGIWGYNPELSAYPVINTDRVSADITPLENTIVVVSSDETVGTAKMSHTGLTHVYANDLVNLKAEVKNEAYAFDGWYLGDSKDTADRVSRDSETSYQVTGAVTLTARFNALPTRNIMAMTFQSDQGNVQVGDGAVGTASQQDVIYGKTTTIKAIAKTGYKFAYWTTFSGYITNPANPEVVNTTAEWTLPLSTDPASYVAMFEPTTSHRIIFQNSNGTILSNVSVENGKDAPEGTRPGDPTMPEKIFDGWVLNDGKDTLTNEQVDAKLKAVTADMTFVATYHNDPAAKTYTITINGGTIQGSEDTTAQKKFNEYVTVVAKAQPDKNFAGWHKNAADGSIVSYDETYTFIVSDSVTLYAAYDDKPVEKLPTVNLDPNVTQVEQGSGYPDLYKLRYVAQINLPEGYEKSACGLILKKK